MLLTIPAVKERIAPVCKAHGVAKVYLFGSYARGEAREDSDVDFHMKVPKEIGLFGLGGIYADLEEALGKEIDLITRIPEENKIFKKYVEREEILLYDRQREGCSDPANYRKAL